MKKLQSVAVLGGGGHAKVVIQTLLDAGFPVSGVYDDAPELRGQSILGVRVRGTIQEFQPAAGVGAVCAIGNNEIRRDVVQSVNADWISAVHPAAMVAPTARIGRGTIVMAGAVIQVDAVIEDHVIVNTGATVDHDCIVNDFCHVAPGANVAGECRLGTGVMMGIGSCSIQQIDIGEWSTVGAGAAVVRHIPSGVVAVGVPAQVQRAEAIGNRESESWS